MIRKSYAKTVFDICNILLMVAFAFVCLAPIAHVVFMSISEPSIVNTLSGIMLWPMGEVSLNGYKLILRNPNIITGYLNTLFYVCAGTSISALFTLIAAYVLSRRRMKYRNVLMFIVTFTMLFSGGLIPFYLVVRNLGLLNSRLSLLFPTALSVMNIIIMRTAFLTVPDSLEESARIDGANDFTILFRILLPVVKATFAVIILFYAVGQWNGWFFASIFIKDRALYPLQLILREILLQNQTASMSDATQLISDNLDLYKPLIKYATIVVSTAPILCVYPFVQKYFVKGVMIGSIKG
ncbi:MAG: carbohydrate ABC transporter permease [Treponemataceae bacterium]